MTKIIIIGCGIGGAAAALSLRKSGFDVRVFERAPMISEVGAGIGLLPNAMRALMSLGIEQAVRANGQTFSVAELYGLNEHKLHTLHLAELAGHRAPLGVVIHRSTLLSTILQALPPNTVVTNTQCVNIEQTKEGVTVHFKNGRQEFADILIGADGIYSVIRHMLFSSTKVRYAGQTCFRGIAHYQIPDREIIREVQGAGIRSSAMAIDRERVYWWAAMNAEQGEKLEPKKQRERLLKHFKNWPFAIAESIEATLPENIVQNDLVDRHPLHTWTKGHTTLLGDAAHPMLPNLGQGACMALEDAVVLAAALRAYRHDHQKALAAYERARISRTTMITNLSRFYGMPCVWENERVVKIRESLTKAIPKYLVARTFRNILEYDAGAVFRSNVS